MRCVLPLCWLCVLVQPAGCASGPDSSTSVDDITQTVEGFGKKLQAVSLQSPNVSEEMTREYSQYVSPDLLGSWVSDPAHAPGRTVSSPWPDRIEISSVSQTSNGLYVVQGEIVEITSVELVSGGAANTIPVRITVQWNGGRWQIVSLVMAD
jgi:hypothetical protein